MKEKTKIIEQLEFKCLEMDNRHQNEMKFLQNEINRFRDDEQYKSNSTNAPPGDHSSTYTHRKLKGTEAIFKPISISHNGTPISINYNSQKHFVTNKKVMSINSNSVVGGNVVIPGPQSTKKKAVIRKIQGEIQKNLLKGYMFTKGDNDSNVNMELSTRTPDKTNPELSPYMMDFYNKKRSLHEGDVQVKIRSSNNALKFKDMKNPTKEQEEVIDTERMINHHKKSKSQSSISGLRSMDHRASHSNIPIEEKQAEPDQNGYKVNSKFLANKSVIPSHKRHLTEPKVAVISIPKNIYNTYSKKKKGSINRRPEKHKKSINTDEPITMRINKSKEKVDIGLCYNTNRSK